MLWKGKVPTSLAKPNKCVACDDCDHDMIGMKPVLACVCVPRGHARNAKVPLREDAVCRKSGRTYQLYVLSSNRFAVSLCAFSIVSPCGPDVLGASCAALRCEIRRKYGGEGYC